MIKITPPTTSTTTLFFSETLPSLEIQEQDLLFFDKYMEILVPDFVRQFPYRFPLTSGEETKTLKFLEQSLEWITSLSHITKPRFIALGGGSIGDCVGFVSSVYKRGCPFIQIPSTWLAALDAAHGGKNALNFKKIKNLLGSFHQAESIYISRALLEASKKSSKESSKEKCPSLDSSLSFSLKSSLESSSRPYRDSSFIPLPTLSRLPTLSTEFDARSELVKIALIDSISLFEDVCNPSYSLWDLLPKAIEAKYKIVVQDPLEKTGLRRVLNLGHTLGHALEASLGLSHGVSVGFGLRFSLYLSEKMGILDNPLSVPFIPSLHELRNLLQSYPSLNLESFLKADKKNEDLFCHFVLVQGPGKVFTQKILISHLQEELTLLTKETSLS
jgi:3-dehydroquinate synthase